MSVRMRHTKGHTGNRRSHHALKNQNVITDKVSGTKRLPHRLDETTGMYRGMQIAAPKKVVKAAKTKGASPEHSHQHDHVHEAAPVAHKNAEAKVSKGIMGKITGGAKPKARSGFGGGA